MLTVVVEFFYRTHDPTTVNRQGGDAGSRESAFYFTFPFHFSLSSLEQG
jgi:peptide methionine sulfoxide reductase MsrA